jgi:hypothetical protein
VADFAPESYWLRELFGQQVEAFLGERTIRMLELRIREQYKPELPGDPKLVRDCKGLATDLDGYAD